jgi:hypothetical protein
VTFATPLTADAVSAQWRGQNLDICDEAGNASRVTNSDEKPSNGVIHGADPVLLPKRQAPFDNFNSASGRASAFRSGSVSPCA